MKRGLNPEDAGRLREWLRANADEQARELRDAGWEEDERGLWRRDGKGPCFHPFDAHARMMRAHE